MLEVLSSGFPHSDTRGSADMCSSPRLFAAYRVLLRLPVPRHPPCALLHLTFSNADTSVYLRPLRFRPPAAVSSLYCLLLDLLKHSYVQDFHLKRLDCLLSFVCAFCVILISKDFTSCFQYMRFSRCVSGIHRIPPSSLRDEMEMKGFEPLTPCLQGRCSPN